MKQYNIDLCLFPSKSLLYFDSSEEGKLDPSDIVSLTILADQWDKKDP